MLASIMSATALFGVLLEINKLKILLRLRLPCFRETETDHKLTMATARYSRQMEAKREPGQEIWGVLEKTTLRIPNRHYKDRLR